jgi:hypothetical protein
MLSVFAKIVVDISVNVMEEVGNPFIALAQAQKTQFYCCIRKTTQRTGHVISSWRLRWCAVA